MTGPSMLTGVGTAAGVSLSSLVFANQQPGTTSSPQTVTVHNCSSAPVNVWASAVGGANKTEFTRTDSFLVSLATLAAGGICTVAVRFGSASTGAKSAKLLIIHDGGGGPESVGLNGTGAAALKPVTADTQSIFTSPVLTSAEKATDKNDSAVDVKRSAKKKRSQDQSKPK